MVLASNDGMPSASSPAIPSEKPTSTPRAHAMLEASRAREKVHAVPDRAERVIMPRRTAKLVPARPLGLGWLCAGKIREDDARAQALVRLVQVDEHRRQ